MAKLPIMPSFQEQGRQITEGLNKYLEARKRGQTHEEAQAAAGIGGPRLRAGMSFTIPHIELELGSCWYCGHTASADCCPERVAYLKLPKGEQEAIRQTYNE